MPKSCLLYYVTDRSAFPGDERARRKRLLEKISEAVRAGVDYIQLREKDMPTRDLQKLASEAVHIVNQLRIENPALKTALLINSRTDVAIAVGAHGVHLRSDDISPREVRAIWEKRAAGAPDREFSFPEPIIGVSCHSAEEVTQAEADGATFAVFAPVFEKKGAPAAPLGLTQLRAACKVKMPVLALGGITLQNAKQCLDAGASGIAAIRLFQENEIAEIVSRLRHP